MNKPEYIDRKALIDDLIHNKSFYPVAVKNAIKDAPTADVVAVVRCKDCVWWEVRELGGTVGGCQNPRNGLWNEYTDEDDFCSYGRRKEK